MTDSDSINVESANVQCDKSGQNIGVNYGTVTLAHAQL